MDAAGHRFTEHTADLACEIWAPTRESLLAQAARAFADSVTEVERLEPRRRARVEAEGATDDELLVAFLEELVYLFETTDLLPARASVKVRETGGSLRLEAEIEGEPFDAERHPLKTLIKGITYHGLAVSEEAAGWRATVIFDI